MVKRLFDLMLSSIALVVLSPLFIIAAIGIRLSSPGPILFKAKRVGYKGRLFTLYKLRTMHMHYGSLRSVITAKKDPRVFKFGALLRVSKIDELPQLFNVFKGDMSIVGPRPEDPVIVETSYRPEYFETFDVKPGLASPGSIYNYTHGESFLEGDDPERAYVERLLPIKIALELVYVRNRSLVYDFKIMLRTVSVILSKALGKTEFSDPPEMEKARRILNSFTANEVSLT